MHEFAYPVLTVLAFFLLGFFADGWSWCWLVFLTVPLYYALFPEHRKLEEDTGPHDDTDGDSTDG